MPKITKLCLAAEQVEELTTARDQHPKAYVRERAAGILKVSQGQSVRQVALHGLHKRRSEHTVKGWIESYLSEGLVGLLVKTGRGRKAAFFPPQPNGSGTGG
jgi:transposase